MYVVLMKQLLKEIQAFITRQQKQPGFLKYTDFALRAGVSPQFLHTALKRKPDRLTIQHDANGKPVGIVLDYKAEEFINQFKK
jgi:hypothetical protein